MDIFASNNESPEIVQDEQMETVEPISQANDQEIMAADQQFETLEQDQDFVQDEQAILDFEPDENGLAPAGSYEQFEPEYDVQTEYIPFSDSDFEVLQTLKSIEYQLKIIAGAQILMIIAWFLWLTIYKPLKNFIRI